MTTIAPGATAINSGLNKITTIAPGATAINSGINKVTTFAPGAATTANTGINKITSMAAAGATATKSGTNKVTTIAPGVTTVNPGINKVTTKVPGISGNRNAEDQFNHGSRTETTIVQWLHKPVRFIKTNDNSAPSGEYQIGTSFGKTIKVRLWQCLNVLTIWTNRVRANMFVCSQGNYTTGRVMSKNNEQLWSDSDSSPLCLYVLHSI